MSVGYKEMELCSDFSMNTINGQMTSFHRIIPIFSKVSPKTDDIKSNPNIIFIHDQDAQICRSWRTFQMYFIAQHLSKLVSIMLLVDMIGI